MIAGMAEQMRAAFFAFRKRRAVEDLLKRNITAQNEKAATMPTWRPEMESMCAVPVVAKASRSLLSIPPWPETTRAFSGSG